MKVYKCRFCNFTTIINPSNRGGRNVEIKSAKYKMGRHYDTTHKELIPPEMTGYQWMYYTLTGKEQGSCIECKNPTPFNDKTMKYSRFCLNPTCKQKYKEERDRRMIRKYGKIHLLNDPEQQKKMQQGRKIAGVYTWSDNKTKFSYLSSYELDFLRFLDLSLKWPVSDIMWPSPHTYEYEYNDKTHFYMPDGFIPSMCLEIEIKDDGSAKNINTESREKDVVKDSLMKSLINYFNYIKIVNKNYAPFLTLIEEDNP